MSQQSWSDHDEAVEDTRSATSSDATTSAVDDPAGATTARPQRAPLRRSRDDRVIAGVAGGLGRYLGIDPVIIRIALVVLAVSGGSGVLLYIIAVIAIPEERPGEIPHDAPPGDQHTGVMVLGTVLLIVGGLLLADRIIPNLTTLIGPLVLIGLGVAVVVGARR